MQQKSGLLIAYTIVVIGILKTTRNPFLTGYLNKYEIMILLRDFNAGIGGSFRLMN